MIEQWPFLTQEEFEEVCTLFDQRYIRASLGPTRQVFKIRQRRIATTSRSYIEIQRLVQLPENDEDLLAAFGKMSAHDKPTTGSVSAAEIDMEMDMETDMTDEDADEEALNPYSRGTDNKASPPYSEYALQPWVKYEIHLHPTYQTPCLWFELRDLPVGESAHDLEAVYRFLVPNEQKARLRALGVNGGISLGHHPITQLPSFLVHPCMTKEAMEHFTCAKDRYLMLWLGLVGPSLGLWLPTEMAQDLG